jgi:uncharacterized membrane protein YphA (DoxX/SURF4 family)
MRSRKATDQVARVLLLIGRVALGALFIYAAYEKLKPLGAMPWSTGSLRISLSMFAMQVDSYQLLPAWGVNLVAHLLPPFELFLGLWLVSGIALRFSSLVTTVLLGGFFVGLTRAYVLGQQISCGCFGPGEQIGPKRLVLEGCFLAVALAVTIGAFLVRHRKRQAQFTEATSPAGAH